MNWVDVVLAAVLLVGVLLGYFSGMLWQVARVVILIVALYAAIHFHAPIAELLADHFKGGNTPRVLGYVITFLFVFLGLYFITWIIEQGIRAAKLKRADRVLGGVVGFFKAFLLCGAILLGLAYHPIDSMRPALQRSFLASLCLEVMNRAVVAMPTEHKEQLEEFLKGLRSVERPSGPGPIGIAGRMCYNSNEWAAGVGGGAALAAGPGPSIAHVRDPIGHPREPRSA